MTVAEWVTLRPIYEICNREMGYEGGGMRRDTWWRKTAAWKQMRATLENILVAARVQQREPSGVERAGNERR